MKKFICLFCGSKKALTIKLRFKKFFCGTAATDFIVSDNYEEKEKLESWNKSSQISTFTTLNEAYENSFASNLFGENENIEGFKREKFGSIKASKQCFTDSLKSQNPFEFPRQQNGDQRNKPEVMQFKASQRLLGSSRPSSASLYFEERMNEQKEDAPNDKIVFTFPWILRRADLGRNLRESRFITTGYKFGAMEWVLRLQSNYFCVSSGMNHPSQFVASNSICNVSYTLFYDDKMIFELYSSPTVSAKYTHIQETYANYYALKTPKGFMTKLKDAFQKEQFAKMVIFVELLIPSKYFLPPFGRTKCCTEYPENFKNDFRFAFLKSSDYSIKCPDGSVPALKIVLNQSSEFMEKHFMESKENELIVEHGIDVIKPIIFFLHSKYFQLPKSYNLDYVDRLMEALDFFEPVHESNAILSFQESLCHNFAEEPLKFDSVLRWIKTAIRYKFDDLFDMIAAVIINKYYYKWIETFPTNARNNQNMLFHEIFGDEGNRYVQKFELIDFLFSNSIFTDVKFY